MLFPGAMLPLHVFEERYRLLVRERRDFVVVLIRHGSEVGPGQGDDIYEIGTLARPERVEELPGGRYGLVVRGLHRVRIASLDRGRPYLRGLVERLGDPPPAAQARLPALLRRYLSSHGVELDEVWPGSGALETEGAPRAVWVTGSVLKIEPGLRQRLLESGDPALAEALLTEELAKLGTMGRLGPITPRRPSVN